MESINRSYAASRSARFFSRAKCRSSRVSFIGSCVDEAAAECVDLLD